MTPLDRRDRIRARAIWRRASGRHIPEGEEWAISIIAAALKREREEAGFAAVGYFFAKSRQAAARRKFLRIES